ncbi:MAG: hypothetical protein KQH53_05340 [Desulfarculaceae bacterium]|nr:hypothetical protein [Desulfarculaceae bacterium]
MNPEHDRQEPQPGGKLIAGPWLRERAERKAREVARRYSQSDGHERLNLWLQHRDLRAMLNELES